MALDRSKRGNRFRGCSYTSRKAFNSGTHRTQSPEETFQLIKPYLRQAGVTRIADITGLDFVGVPTTLALRPNAPTMACSSGKGVTLAQAYVSGGMEAIELYAAETANFSPIHCSYEELAGQYRMPPPEHLWLTNFSLFAESWPFYWCLGWDLVTQSELPVPMAMVGMAKKHMRGSMRSFLASSNGLGAGNSFLEAVAAGLYEVIERDGVACHHHAALHRQQPIPVLTDDLLRSYPLVEAVVEKCENARVDVVVQDCTTDIGVPTYMAFTYDETNRGIPVTRGYGAHLDPGIALLRAVTESLQGRLNFIAGSRDDLFRSAYTRARAGWHESVAALQHVKLQAPKAPERVLNTSDTFERDVLVLLNAVQPCGLPTVIVFELTPESFPIHVVRVLVPGLEGYMHHGYHPGPRARRFDRKKVSP